MKKYLLIILSLISLTGFAQPNEFETKVLNPKKVISIRVKSILDKDTTTNVYTFTNSLVTELKEFDKTKLKQSTKWKYDNNKLIFEETTTDATFVSKYLYDKNGLLIKEIGYKNNELQYKNEYKYKKTNYGYYATFTKWSDFTAMLGIHGYQKIDKKGNVFEYKQETIYEMYNLYKSYFNENNLLIKFENISSMGFANTHTVTTYKYDRFGNEIEKKNEDDEVHCSYKYDKYNNWIECKQANTTKFIRDIQYKTEQNDKQKNYKKELSEIDKERKNFVELYINSINLMTLMYEKPNIKYSELVERIAYIEKYNYLLRNNPEYENIMETAKKSIEIVKKDFNVKEADIQKKMN